jgi:hypothetical protein
MRAAFKPIAVGLLSAFLLNLIWENAQAPLYVGYNGFAAHFWSCFSATGGDVLIVAMIYCAFALLTPHWNWYRDADRRTYLVLASVGAVAAIILEWWALATSRWSYAAMPIIPIFGVGLLPVLQLTLIPPAVVFLVRSFAEAIDT